MSNPYAQAAGSAPPPIAVFTTSGNDAWSTGAPANPAAAPPYVASQHDGSPLAAPSRSTASRGSFTQSPHSPAGAADTANVVFVPAAADAADASRQPHDRPVFDSATDTQPPFKPVRQTSRLSKQSSSYLNTPSLSMTAWRGGLESARRAADVDVDVDVPNATFDPTEVPTLRYTMNITVTRDGKVVEEALDPYEVARLYGQQQAALRSLQSRYDFLAVPDWVRVHPLLGTYFAEFIGTFAWVLTLALVSVRNESIFTVADDTNITSIPIGFMFTSMIFTFGYVSSSHFNPAVSVAVFLVRQMELSQCFAYILCQLAGSFLAGIVSMIFQGNTDVFIPSVSSSYITSGIFSELIFTFAICLVVLNIAYSRQSGNFFYGFAVGMTITAGSASVGRISGGAFNPAAATGLQVAMCIVSNCDDLKSVWIYWLAPLIGAVAAALLFSQMVQPQDTQVLEDNKVFQDVNLLQKQRMAAMAAAAAGGGASGSAAAHRRNNDDETESTYSSSESESSARRPHSPTSSETSTASQDIQYVPHATLSASAPIRSREEVEEEEEEEERDSNNNNNSQRHSAAPPQAARDANFSSSSATAGSAAVAPATSVAQRPALANNSDLDNWRKLPPPRRDDDGGKAVVNQTSDSSWF